MKAMDGRSEKTDMEAIEEEKRRIPMEAMEGRPKETDVEATEEEKGCPIPRDVYAGEILPRLPANNLLSSKLVCKDWLQLISSPQFIRDHLYRSKAGLNGNGTRILMPLPCAIIDYKYHVSGNIISKEEIPYPPKFSGKDTLILGSCDGLIFLVDKGSSHKFAVFNPSTGKSDVVAGRQDDFHVIFCSWFGHHPTTGEYVLVLGRLVLKPHYRREIGVHKFSRKLKAIHTCSIDLQAPGYYHSREERGTFLHGLVHWPAHWVYEAAGSVYVISAYDLQKNKFLEFSPPRQSDFKLGVLDGCLFAILKPGEMDIFELWIMKEYGLGNSWTKYRNIEGYNNCSVLSPLSFFPNGDLIIEADGSKLTQYNFNDKEATVLNYHKRYDIKIKSRAIACADSLVSPAIWGK